MPQTHLEALIPEGRLAAVRAALQATFNTAEVADVTLLAGGLSSALVYRLTIGGKSYVLRLIMQVDPLRDPVRQFACMNSAAAAGIAPAVYYAGVEDGLSIIAYVEARPLSQSFAAKADLLLTLAGMIRSIHALPLFPPLVGFLDGVDIFIQQYKALNFLPERLTAEHFAHYAAIQRVYPRHDPDLVSSHNDLNPNNLLFDGERLWVIDWETAFRSDRYVDLAIAARSFVADEAQETFYLSAYFGEAPDEYQRARSFLMQQVCHMYYAMIMLRFAAATRPPQVAVDENMETPRLWEFHQAVGAGQVSLASYDGQLLYGKVLLNEALINMQSARFAKSVRRM